MAEQSDTIQDVLVKKEFENRLALLRRKLEIGHGKLLEPVDVSRQDMDQIEDILSLFGTVKQEDIKAKYEDGILKLSVPKKEQKKVETTKRIAIEG